MDAMNAARTYIRLVRALEERAGHRAGESALTLTEIGILGQIDRGCMLPSSIARAMALDPGRITRLTDRLFALNYIRRDTDPEDRRRCPLGLTEEGRRRLEQGRQHYADAMAAILEGLTADERAGLLLGTAGLARVLTEVGGFAGAPS
jgi:DNA-binding MarR family transcriptional regulator